MDSNKVKEFFGISSDKKIVLTIGNLLKNKGIEYFIGAADILYKRIKNIRFVIIGNGTQYKYLTSMINKLNLRGIVNILDPMPQNDLRVWLNASNVFVLPSLKEGLGMVQIEAMACGKPVVATKNGGSETIITNKNLGILVAPKHADELAKGIHQALNKSWNSKYIISQAMRYTPSKISREIAYLFSTLLINKKPYQHP
jgi:glycosyltransferase involved in cell wall biosynthesis